MTSIRFPDQNLIEQLVKTALAEDVGEGDHTSLSTIPENSIGKARLLAKESGVLAGVVAAVSVFNLTDPKIEVNVLLEDGSMVSPGDVVLTLNGPAQSILVAERLVLNIMQRMSGIATKTYKLTSLINDLPCTILDTRKTTPGFRYFEKWAVVIGGGANHRFGLFDMIMIKDNHVDYAGGITAAINKAKDYLVANRLNIPIEVETRNMSEVTEALQAGGINRIMLDNFSPRLLAEAVEVINNRVETEASGGITEENLREYAETGVDFISMGTLTHHVKSLDLSLKAM